MASISRSLKENIPGDFFVDSSCIDCDACRQIAPSIFRDHGDQSSVHHQPSNESELAGALRALVACPTGSIGDLGRHDARAAASSFPSRISENVYFCGFTSPHSFGAWSYLIVRPESNGGNILVDSPRFTRPLVKRLEEMGGIATMFLTHQDDIADHERFHSHFGCRRVMHEADGAVRRGMEIVVKGEGQLSLDDELLVMPVPGHTRGHMVLLYRNKFLFTGDHLAWSPEKDRLTAFRSVAWYSWAEQTRSMAKLLALQFEWVLPGHGRIHHASAEEMHLSLKQCIEWMKRVA